MDIEVIVGANYGDEGKGLVTEARCRQASCPIVILTNGGCQRAHTVTHKDIKHVFQHFGSGTLLDVPTFFPRTYLLNPIQFVEEYTKLLSLGHRPTCFCDPRCNFQFPFDMALNQSFETARGDSKHGSCGWGIWESVQRVRDNDYVSISDFHAMSIKQKHDCYISLAKKRINKRLADENGLGESDATLSIVLNEAFISHFIMDFEFMYDAMKLCKLDEVSSKFNTLVFENAQGLLLDQDYQKNSIWSTPSCTGLKSVVDLISESIDQTKIKSFNTNYVSRTYLTRHGAGPFEENKKIHFLDKTNQHNIWQGSLKFGDLNYDDLQARVDLDFKLLDKIICSSKQKNIILTHANEVKATPDKLKANGIFISDEDNSQKVLRI